MNRWSDNSLYTYLVQRVQIIYDVAIGGIRVGELNRLLVRSQKENFNK